MQAASDLNLLKIQYIQSVTWSWRCPGITLTVCVSVFRQAAVVECVV